MRKRTVIERFGQGEPWEWEWLEWLWTEAPPFAGGHLLLAYAESVAPAYDVYVVRANVEKKTN